MADAPASSMRRTFSSDSESGVEEITIGPLSLRPRYFVDTSIILILRQAGLPVFPQASLRARYGASRRGLAWLPGPSKRATGARRHPARPSAVPQPVLDCCARASYSEPR